MQVIELNNGKYVTKRKGTTDDSFGYSLGDNDTRLHHGVKELFRFWKHYSKFPIKELETGLLEACQKGHNVLEFGDVNGTFMYSLKSAV